LHPGDCKTPTEGTLGKKLSGRGMYGKNLPLTSGGELICMRSYAGKGGKRKA